MNYENQILGFVGTYTKSTSKGIYSFHLDKDAGVIKDINCVVELSNPTYLTISENKQYLYSVIKDGDLGGIATFSISETGQLNPLNSTLVEGAPPCHVSIESENKLLSANYHKGTVEYYPIMDDGKVQPATSIVYHEGSGPDPRQEKAHAHFASFSPDRKFIIAIDLGTDEIYTYKQINDNLIEHQRFTCTPGSGPRHLVFHPNQPYVYVMTEFSSEVIVLNYNAEEGSFEHIQTISTLPDHFSENNQGSAIHISRDGKFVYAANRGHDSIAVFKVNDKNFELTFVEHTSTEGNWPRDFSLDPTEMYLVASNQNSNNLTLYSRDSDTGKLTLLQKDIEVPEPVCIKFL
ncbi:lactonase family protein [Bacillus sp. B15-48]|uniref:lactonase family protein n=1 Tax=Bacillus sp. B15-48 TaxID=1548601 RepID=UPI00193F8FFF|nr:lactonase family protein [Bacillus sp. B15-48]MBM4760688.1 beta-propeller fold lactonase family protein [Bacillus sp. B15-48]